MKNFLKILFSSCLGSFIALMLFFVVGIFMLIGVIGAVSGSLTGGASAEEFKLSKNTILKLDMSSISDKVEVNPFDSFLGEETGAVSLIDVIKAINKAKENPNIEGIYINIEGIDAGTASIDAVRRALLDFKSSGKFIVAYGDSYSQKSYYLASVADKVLLNPEGEISLVGLSSSSMMMKDAYDKLGVKMEIFKVGKFKGAVEPGILNKLSDENRLQIQEYLDGLWYNITEAIANARGISRESLLDFVNDGKAFDGAQVFVDNKLVDALVYRSEVEDIVRSMIKSLPEDIRMATVSNMKTVPFLHKPQTNDEVYVLFAEGTIMPEEFQSPYGGESLITYDLVDKLKELEEDDDIKAVVLRVNSPGGSAFLSEQIWKAIKDLRKTKTVVISMGDLAASGGYYISSAGEYIVAEKNTLTGSIGIYGQIPNAEELAKKIGVNIDVVKTSPYADFNMSEAGLSNVLRPMSPESKAKIQASVERGYKTFISRVAEGRNMTLAQVDSIGQGRVWLGAKALDLKLVDEIGGIDVAVKKAAEFAGISNYKVVYSETQIDSFSEMLLKSTNITDDFKAKMLSKEERLLLKELKKIYSNSGILAKLPFDIYY